VDSPEVVPEQGICEYCDVPWWWPEEYRPTPEQIGGTLDFGAGATLLIVVGPVAAVDVITVVGPKLVAKRLLKASAEELLESQMVGRPPDPINVLLDAATEVGDDVWIATRQGKATTYSVAYEMELDPDDYGASRSTHRRRASAALNEDLQSDPGFAHTMEALIPDVAEYAAGERTPPNWRWHHCGTRMQLVPLDQHSPGSRWWDALHPGGAGGFHHLEPYRVE
jgi:hypothetical protein